MKKTKGNQKLANDLRLAVAKQTLDRYQKDGFQAARHEVSRLENMNAGDAILAAFTKGAAGANLYDGFRVMVGRGDEAAGAEWLRLVLSTFAHDVRRDFGVDLDLFLVGPAGHDLLGHNDIGRKVEPKHPKTEQERRASKNVIAAAMSAMISQLVWIDEIVLAGEVEELLLRFTEKHTKTKKSRKVRDLIDDLDGLADGQDDQLGKMLKRAVETLGEYQKLLETRETALASRA